MSFRHIWDLSRGCIYSYLEIQVSDRFGITLEGILFVDKVGVTNPLL